MLLQVIDASNCIFLLCNFTNMKSLNAEVVFNALVGGMIFFTGVGQTCTGWGFFLSQLRWLGSDFIVSGARQRGARSLSLM